MADEITIRANGRAEMAYVGELPWHKLGQAVTQGASIDVWKREAGLDWEALSATVQYHNQDGLLLPVNSRKVIYRSDNSQPVGFVSDKYEVVQPAQVLESMRALTEAGGWHIHTAGTLRGGSKVWAMASQHIQGVIKKNDKVLGNLLIATSLDGSMKTTAALTAVRVVCANTLRLALNTTDNKVSISHRTVFNPEEMLESLGLAVDSFDLFMHHANEMADTPIKLDEAREILRGLFGQPVQSNIKPEQPDYEFQRLMAQFSKTPDQKQREQRSVARALSLFGGEGMGSALPGSIGTRWGLLNAITQHVDHEMGRTDDTRMESAWFGRGDAIKTEAFELLTA